MPVPGAGEMARRLAELDWAATPIGPAQRWPASLRTAVGICLASRHPMVIWWGPELVLIYNDAWIPILGPAKHPALGKPGAAVWPEMWHIIGEQLSDVLRTGEATWSDDQLLPARRHGYLEEAYFTYSYSAIRDAHGGVGGAFTAVTETTGRVLGERRMATLGRLGEVSALTAASDVDACRAALAVLAENPADVPAAMVYLLDPGGAAARRVATTGLCTDHPAIPELLTDADPDRHLWRAVRSGSPVLSTGLGERCPGLFTAPVTPMGPAAPTEALVLPVTSARSEVPIAVLYLGVSPFRALDHEYRTFFELVADQVGSAINDARAYEAERAQAFRLLAEHADDIVGRHDPDGTWRYVSPSAHRMSGWLPEQLVGRHPLELIHPDDHGTVLDALGRLADGPAELLMRLRRADGTYRWVETRGRLVTEPGSGEVELQTVSRDVDARVVAEQQLHAERERYRALVQQVDVGIFRTDACGAMVFVNDRLLTLAGCGREDLRDGRWLRRLHPEDRRAARVGVGAAVAARRGWVDEYRVLPPDGADGVCWVRASAQPLHDAGGAFLGYLGTCVDITDLRTAEDARRAAAVARAAHEASSAAAARMQALVNGLAAVVWEAEAHTGRYTFVSERVVELLGHPVARWLGEPGFWSRIVHPEDRAAATAFARARIAAGADYEHTYRALAADGATVWLHDVVHVVRDDTGTPVSVQGVMIDVTEQKRAEQATALLAQLSRAGAGREPPAARLEALVATVAGAFGELAVVTLADPEGRLRTVVAIAPDRPEVEQVALSLPPHDVPASLSAEYAAGRPFVVQEPSAALVREAVRDEEHVRARMALGVRTALVVPLTAPGRLVGSLSYHSLDRPRGFDAADLALAAEIGRRVTALVVAERAAARERQLQRITGALAAAETLPQVADVLTAGMAEAFGADAQSLYVLDTATGRLRVAHTHRYRAAVVERFATIGPRDEVPHAVAARTGDPVWIHDHDDWARFPGVGRPEAGDLRRGACALPLHTGGRVVAVLGASFAAAREWPADEREFAMSLASAAAQAVQRALDGDRRRSVAETLQHSLLPAVPPVRDHLLVATRYLPAVAGVQAGGDWYDVVALDEHRTAIVVGDFVGQGAPAAAVMGQLRSALSGVLTVLADTGGAAVTSPAVALAHLHNHTERQLPEARASTAVCLVVDTAAHRMRWACAGHPPPLLITGAGQVRYLDGGAGPLLGAVGAGAVPGPYREGSADLEPGDTVLLYTDGLVERRGEVIDEGMARLAAAARRHPGAPPAALVTALLAAAVPDGRRHDDIAAIAVRFLPPPLRERRPARPAELRRIRRTVQRWAVAAALPDELVHDLQLALGEAVANAVEHAYGDGEPGELEYTLRCAGGATSVEVAVTDFGTWRPRPADRGFRGRGLDLIEGLAGDGFAIEHGDGGATTVRFALAVPVPDPDAPPPAPGPPAAGSAPGVLDVAADADRVCLVLRGDLDLAAVAELRDRVLDALAGDDPRPLVLDLTGVGYLASAGVGLVLEVVAKARSSGRRVTLHHGGGAVARTVALAGLDEL
ncbi:MAG: PAS domain-containing protein [Pseudonocardia sp.]